jgi:hypothetical protein
MASSETSDWLLELLGLNKVPCKRHVHRKKPRRSYPLHWRARFLSDDGLRERDQCFGPIRDVAIARDACDPSRVGHRALQPQAFA